MNGDARGPRMQRTRWTDLVLVALVVGVVAYLVVRLTYDSLPPLNVYLPVTLAVLAVAELIAARRVRAAVRHDPDAKPMTAIAIARCVALGKSSSLVGAGVSGAAGGLLARLLPQVTTVTATASDARVGGFLLVVALLLTGAGVLLERAGIDPNNDRHGRSERA